MLQMGWKVGMSSPIENELIVGRLLAAATARLLEPFLGSMDKYYRAHPWCDLGYGVANELKRLLARMELIRGSPPAGVCLGGDFRDLKACHRLRHMAKDIQRSILPAFLLVAVTTNEALED